jgi:hypothetical protein
VNRFDWMCVMLESNNVFFLLDDNFQLFSVMKFWEFDLWKLRRNLLLFFFLKKNNINEKSNTTKNKNLTTIRICNNKIIVPGIAKRKCKYQIRTNHTFMISFTQVKVFILLITWSLLEENINRISRFDFDFSSIKFTRTWLTKKKKKK